MKALSNNKITQKISMHILYSRGDENENTDEEWKKKRLNEMKDRSCQNVGLNNIGAGEIKKGNKLLEIKCKEISQTWAQQSYFTQFKYTLNINATAFKCGSNRITTRLINKLKVIHIKLKIKTKRQMQGCYGFLTRTRTTSAESFSRLIIMMISHDQRHPT